MTGAQPTASPSSRAARELGDLLASIEVRANWRVVETTAQALANELRNRGDSDEHTALGKTLLPQTVNSLLKTAFEGSSIPDDERAPAVLELLRVGANLCMDHNENRGYLLDAGFPETTVTLLEGYVERLPGLPSTNPLPLPDIHLKIVRTVVGALLNLSLGYEPVQTRLIALEVPETLLRLSISIYPPGSWLGAKDDGSAPVSAESWLIRRGITDWSWRAISALRDNQEPRQSFFGPELLPYLVIPLQAFIPPFSTPDNLLYADTDTRRSLLVADVEVLEEVCELIEGMTMDIEDVKLALARGMADHEQPPCLALMLDFIESVEYLPLWDEPGVPPEDAKRWKHVADLCKTAIIRSVVEVSGEDGNLNVLWDDALPEDSFVSRLIRWLQAAESHDDLVICASLSLGNLVRQENHSITLVKEPISITKYLIKHLTPGTDIKVKHGVIGLLKHLAQTTLNRAVLGDAGVLEALRTSGVFNDRADITETVQLSAINLAKFLCTNNVSNSIVCTLDASDEQLFTSLLDKILALSRRSDITAVKSEGARVLANVVKSLCSASGDVRDPRRQTAIKAVTNAEFATDLARLLGRSIKHNVLLNESIVGLCLLSLQPKGGLFVLDAIVAELPKEISPSRQNSLDSALGPSARNGPSTPIAGPKTALDVLVLILKNSDGRFQTELRVNLCHLLGEIGRESLKRESGGREVEVDRVRTATRDVLQVLQSTPDSLALSAAARKALEAW